MLRNRNEERFRLSEALFYASGWGIGAAVGVALGGWLTLVGGSGAPGAGALDPISDIVVLPGFAFGAVTVIHLIGQLITAALRGRAVARRQG